MRCLVFLMTLLATGCVSIPDTYAPPQQRRPLAAEEPSPLKPYVHMNEASAPVHFLKGVGQNVEGGTWRWAQPEATLMFSLPQTKGWKFSADYTIPEITFKDTGPVTVKVTINSHELESVRVEQPGGRKIEKPVPEEWLHAKDPNLVTFTVDKTWVSPTDGVKLGFVLTAAGFVQ